jgi:AraC-like DNA-binding protein
LEINKRYTETNYFGKIEGSLRDFYLKAQARHLGLSLPVPNAFVKRFKKFTGTTPLNYRRDQQAKLKTDRAIALPPGITGA